MTIPTKKDALNVAITFERWSVQANEFSDRMKQMAEAAHTVAVTMANIAEILDETSEPEPEAETTV